MKFALKLDANRYSDWPYVDYKALKKALKDSKPSTSGSGAPSLLASPKPSSPDTKGSLKALREPLLEYGQVAPETDEVSYFMSKLREQRDTVQTFYVAELDRCQKQLQLLLAQLKPNRGTKQESSLVRASTDLYRTLQQLRNYAILNYTALLKAAKKFDKKVAKKAAKPKDDKSRRGSKGIINAALDVLSRSTDLLPSVDGSGSKKQQEDDSEEDASILADWTTELAKSSFVNAEALDEVCTDLEVAFANAICDGSVQMARATLLVRKERPNSSLLLSLGVRAGVCMALLFWVLWDIFVDVRVMDLNLKRPRDRVWMATQLPVYRAGLAVVLIQFLWAGCLYVWSRARINFEFMLDFGPRANTNAAYAASNAARTFIFYLLSLLLFVKAIIGELPANVSPGVFPVAMFVVTFGSMLLPLRAGKDILNSVGEVFAAPMYHVHFCSVLVGDVLTSMVKPLQDIAYSLCYIGTAEFNLPYGMQGNCHSSPIFREVVIPVICAFPLWCRFMQCLRVYHDTQKRVPALPNAFKYAMSMLVVLFGEMHPFLTSGDNSTRINWVRYAWLLIYLVSTLYTWLWDVVVDWKLGQPREGGLRPRRMFAHKGYYYAAILVDLLLRFAWTSTLVPHWFAISELNMYKMTNVGLIPAVIVLELCRRAMWAVFRLEAEHLHNTEGFRRVELVPLHFDHATSEGAKEKTDANSHRVERILEALVYVGVAGVLVYAAVSLPLGGDDVVQDGDESSAPPGAPGGDPVDRRLLSLAGVMPL